MMLPRARNLKGGVVGCCQWLLFPVHAVVVYLSCLFSNYKRLSSGVFAACRQIDEDSMGRGAAKLFNRNLVATVCEHGTSTKRPITERPFKKRKFTKSLFKKRPITIRPFYNTSSLLNVYISKRPGYKIYFYKSSFLLHVFTAKL
jgi:hypothetical protein